MIWTAERNQRQGQIVADIYRAAAGVPCDRLAVMAGGLPGADKPAVLAVAEVDPARYLTVSVAALLEELAARAMIPQVEDLSPMEASMLVHTEAQFLAKRVALRGLSEGRNLLFDLSMASVPSVTSWLGTLRSAAYAVTGVFADLEIEESVRRADAAHRAGEEAYQRGQGHGGRFIPAHAIRALADHAGGRPSGAIVTGPVDLWFGGSEVMALIEAWRAGRLTRSELADRLRQRDWPPVPPTCPPDLDVAKAAIDDPEPYVPGSFDDVCLACDLSYLTDSDYAELASLVARAADPAGPA